MQRTFPKVPKDGFGCEAMATGDLMVRMRQEYLAYLGGLFSTGQPSAIYVLLCWTQLCLLIATLECNPGGKHLPQFINWEEPEDHPAVTGCS